MGQPAQRPACLKGVCLYADTAEWIKLVWRLEGGERSFRASEAEFRSVEGDILSAGEIPSPRERKSETEMGDCQRF